MSAEFFKRLYGLAGRVAVVLGGDEPAGGIVAEGLAQAGATIVLAGRSASRGYRCVDILRALGAPSGFLPVDATSFVSLAELLDQVLGEHGHVDLLIHAGCETVESPVGAGTVEASDPPELRSARIELACRTFARAMAKQDGGGAILNLCLETPASPLGVYPSERRAITDLTRGLARQLAPAVRVNALCGRVSLSHRPIEANGPQSPPADLGHIPLARWGEPSELIGPVLTLVSPRAGSYLTGVVLDVDGGLAAWNASFHAPGNDA